MPDYRVADDGSFIDKATGEKLVISRKGVARPAAVISDIGDYVSPVTGKPVSGRVQRREDMKRAGCIDARELGPSFGQRKGVKSEKWAKRLGLPLQGRDI